MSMSFAEASPRSSMRMLSSMYGTKSLLTMNLRSCHQLLAPHPRPSNVPRRILALHRHLLHRVAQLDQRVPRLVARALGLNDLDQLHLRHRALRPISSPPFAARKRTHLNAWNPAKRSCLSRLLVSAIALILNELVLLAKIVL